MPYTWIVLDREGKIVERTNNRTADRAKQSFLFAVAPNRFPPPQFGVDKLQGFGLKEAWSQFEAQGFTVKRFELVDAIRNVEDIEVDGERYQEALGREGEVGSGDSGGGSPPAVEGSDEH